MQQRLAAEGEEAGSNIASFLKRFLSVAAPSVLTAYQQLSLVRTIFRAVIDGTCVFLLAGMLCHQLNEAA